MNQYTGAPDQGGQRMREIRLGIAVLANARRFLNLIRFTEGRNYVDLAGYKLLGHKDNH